MARLSLTVPYFHYYCTHHAILFSMSTQFFSPRSRNAISWPLSTHEILRPRPRLCARWCRLIHENTIQDESVPFRKQLKDEVKKLRAAGRKASRDTGSDRARGLDRWELTVGIEIHAQLNTDRKLFSSGWCNVGTDGFNTTNTI